MSEIRPTLPPVAPSAGSAGPTATARAAQAAFFQAALGQAAAARPSGMAGQLAAQASVAPDAGRIPAGTVERSSRPGALLDIRV